jgi:hypothetical protein
MEVRSKANLNAKTFSYLCTKSTTGICASTMFHERLAITEFDWLVDCEKVGIRTYDR